MKRHSQVQGWCKNNWHTILEKKVGTYGRHQYLYEIWKYESPYSQVCLEIRKPKTQKTVITEKLHEEKILLSLLSWWLCLNGSLRRVQCWSPFRCSKISSMKSKTCPLTWPAIHLSLKRTSKLKKVLFGNMSYMEATIILLSYVSNQFWGTFKLKHYFEHGTISFSFSSQKLP